MTIDVAAKASAVAPAPDVELGSRRVLHPGPLRWLRALGWMLLLFVVVAIGAFPPMLLFQTVAMGPLAAGAALLQCAVTALLYTGLVRLGEARLPRELSLRPALAELSAGVAIGAVLFASVMAVMAAGGFYEIRAAPPTDVWGATVATIQSGFLEELLMRAIVLRLLWRAFGLSWAIALSAALFGALHLTNPNASWFAAVCIALEAGLLLAALYALTGRLWACVGAHAAWNFTQGWVFGVTVSGVDLFGGGPLRSTPVEGAPEAITGGAFGAEASLPALVVVSAAAVLLLALAWRRGRFQRLA